AAEPLLARSTELYPRDPAAWNALRNLRIAAGRWPDALSTARAGAAANPEDVEGRTALAWMLAECPDASLREPVESLRIARALDAEAGGAKFEFADLLSLALAANGEFAEAATAARRAAELARAAGEREIAGAIEERALGYASRVPQ